ncbi:SusC/RagA family TonB-linked outer membrane protein [Polaribacter batillariae]|uniref:SusC/RagA family TonB-linked outer membrane protein n=1 Tax=Polaribacter batillariae TaxID=2808900 RepID=A0ABX7SRM6_9FLAO|nr:SusC/RagA family TonB-linked outer membrane protein [Polaribacter batillariae]QTD36910.1 SusC/RagA family TonB-linked outer membrane protein [Polaribacter batillariae]
MKKKLIESSCCLIQRKFLLLMRVFVFFFFTTVFSFNTENALSQNTKIVIEHNETLNIHEVFDIIRDQTNHSFIYHESLFDNLSEITLKKGIITVGDLLRYCLPNNQFDFEFTSKQNILIKKHDPNIQQLVISGKVTDNNGITLPGVNIYTDTKKYGVSTDIEGNFTMRVPSGTNEIIFSYIGYVEKRLVLGSLNNTKNITVILKEEVNTLNEIVVTGYQTLSKERTTGAFESINTKLLEQRPAANFQERLVGQVPGLNINPLNGNIEIRGRSTINEAFSLPLVVLDGFPLTNQDDFNTINPEDIESINVLKDAAASSIWGSRASNGVIVITTKKGKKNQKLSIDFSSFIEVENKVNFNDFNWLNTSEEIDLDIEFIDKNWVNFEGLIGQNSSFNDLHLGYIYRKGLTPNGSTWLQSTLDDYVNNLRTRDITKDWSKYLLRNAMRHTYNLSFRGGSEKNTYFASLSYTNLFGQAIGDKNDRLSFNLRDTYQLNEKINLTAGLTTVLRNEKNNGTSPSIAAFLQPYDRLVNEFGEYVQQYRKWNPWVSQERENLLGSPYTFNYLEEQRNLDDTGRILDVRADVKLDVEVFKDFTVSSSFRYETGSQRRDEFRDMTLPSHRNFINDYFVNGGYQIPVGSEYVQEEGYYKGWTFRNNITWDKRWKDHDLTVFAGGEYQRRFSELTFNRLLGYDRQSTNYVPYDEFGIVNRTVRNWNNGFRLLTNRDFFDLNNTDNRFVSFYSNVGYSFKKKYLFNASYRVDQANIFGSNPDFRYKPLWSVGVGWEIAKEDFMAQVSWINRLKFRATYGLGGNSLSSVSPFVTTSPLTATFGRPYPYLRLTDPGNPDLKWEETATTNLALDFSLFDNRISGSFEYYIKKSDDVYSSRPLDPTVGFQRALVNYANIENEGIELQLNAKVIKTPDFDWNLRININHNKNLVTENISSQTTLQAHLSGLTRNPDKAVSNYYSYNFAGLDSNGEVLLLDRNGETKLWNETFTVDDLVYSGSRVPEDYGGLSSTFRYKDFDLTVNMNYQANYVFRAPYDSALSGFGAHNNTGRFGNARLHKIWGTRWQQPGDEATTSVPRIFYNGLNPITNENESSTDMIRMHQIWSQSTFTTLKGDYLRVQDIILGYSFSKQNLERTFLNKLRLTMQITNPFLWVKNKAGVDPTAPQQNAYTNLTRYTFGVRANF